MTAARRAKLMHPIMISAQIRAHDAALRYWKRELAETQAAAISGTEPEQAAYRRAHSEDCRTSIRRIQRERVRLTDMPTTTARAIKRVEAAIALFQQRAGELEKRQNQLRDEEAAELQFVVHALLTLMSMRSNWG